jgi:hypothetical protein
VAARSKAWALCRALAGIVGSTPLGGGHGCLSLVSVVGCQIETSATEWLLVQKSRTECGVCK